MWSLNLKLVKMCPNSNQYLFLTRSMHPGYSTLRMKGEQLQTLCQKMIMCTLCNDCMSFPVLELDLITAVFSEPN